MAPRPFIVNAVQTAISISYKNPAFSLIADKVLPRVPVGGEKFSWRRTPIAQAATLPATEVGRRGRLNRVEFSSVEEDASIRDYGLEDSIPYTDVEEAERMRAQGEGAYDPVNYATETLTNLILLDREVRVASIVQDPSSYASQNRLALAGSDQFSNPDSDVIGTIKRCFDKSLFVRPNNIAFSREVWGKISSHPQLVNACKGNVTTKGIITLEEFRRLFEGEGLTQVSVGEALVNITRPGQSPVLNRVWGRHMMFSFIDPSARPQGGITFGWTAEYGKRIAGSWEDKNVGLKGGIVVRVGERVREIVTCPEAGFLLQNVVS